MKTNILLGILAILCSFVAFNFGKKTNKSQIEQLDTKLALQQQKYDLMDRNRPNLDEVQRLYVSIHRFHDAIAAMGEVEFMTGRVTDIDADFNMKFQEIYDQTILSSHVVKLKGYLPVDEKKTRELLEKMVLGYPEPRVVIAMETLGDGEDADTIREVVMVSSYDYVQGELIDLEAGNGLPSREKQFSDAMLMLQQYGLKPTFNPTKKQRVTKPRL